MFFHLFINRLKRIVRSKEELFWTICFPLILGTFFFTSFGSLVKGNVPVETPNVAIVRGDGNAVVIFNHIIGNVDVVNVVKTQDEKDAKAKLANGDVDGIIYVDDTLDLSIKKNSIKTSIIKTFLDQCIQYTDTYQKLYKNNPEQIKDIAIETSSFLKKETLGSDLSPFTQYFYALFSMCCLFGAFSGLTCSMTLQPNVSSLGARRSIAPANKLLVIFADFTATVLLQFVSNLVLYAYLSVICGLDFGPHTMHFFLVLFTGSLAGVSLGTFIGALSNLSEGAKVGMITGISLTLCFFSGLMMHGIKGIIEKYCPFFNQINPAALISDALYTLNSLDSMSRYYTNIGILFVEALALCVGSFLIVRRLKYASI